MTGELSGVNLARQALVAAREAARKSGATAKKPKRRTTTVARRDGREPLGLGAAISMMMTEHGLVAPAAGGSVLAHFDTILAAAAPELAGHVRAAGFDADTGRLNVVPDAPAVGTKLRWSAPKLITAANEKVPNANVHALHVLAPAPKKAGPATAAVELAPQPTAPVASVEPRTPSGDGTRREAPDGYRQTLAAHRAAWNGTKTADPEIQAAHQRQVRSQAREPEEQFGNGRQTLAELRAKTTAQQQVRPNDTSLARALHRLAAERAGLATIAPAVTESHRSDRTA
ncbi:DciA family protein [Streptomyces halstedii]|uniref:DciA family protein n=1 Tax=Streptomyces halstedii TaxID=1944 RepID=UPI00382F02F4